MLKKEYPNGRMAIRAVHVLFEIDKHIKNLLIVITLLCLVVGLVYPQTQDDLEIIRETTGIDLSSTPDEHICTCFDSIYYWNVLERQESHEFNVRYLLKTYDWEYFKETEETKIAYIIDRGNVHVLIVSSPEESTEVRWCKHRNGWISRYTYEYSCFGTLRKYRVFLPNCSGTYDEILHYIDKYITRR